MNKYLTFAPILLVLCLTACSQDSAETEIYYDKHQLSMLKKAEDKTSKADELINYLTDKENDKTADSTKFGEKFFLTIVRKGCKGCMDVMPGFEYLEANWGQNDYKDITNPNAKFLNYVIYANEENNDPNVDLFTNFYNEHNDFFKASTENISKRPYYRVMGGMNSSYGNNLKRIIEGEHFPTPTTYMIDFNYKAAGKYGIVDILFNFNNKDATLSNKELAYTLASCWNHNNMFDSSVPAK